MADKIEDVVTELEKVKKPMAEIEDVMTELEKVKKPQHLSVESLLLLITTDRLHKLENDSRRELHELKERQKKVSFLHKLTKTLHAGTSSEGELDLSQLPEDQLSSLKEMMLEAKELGVELNEEKQQYNSDERERLLENVRMTIEDFNVQNEMQLQMVTRLTNERYESYQMARSILKPLHDDKMNKARAMGGR